MISIKELLNKIKWDPRENPEDYSLYYYDRITGKKIRVEYRNIIRTDGSFVVIKRKEQEAYIPFHRIREVRKGKAVVWSRKLNK